MYERTERRTKRGKKKNQNPRDARKERKGKGNEERRSQPARPKLLRFRADAEPVRPPDPLLGGCCWVRRERKEEVPETEAE
jgi:hypothetical protein